MSLVGFRLRAERIRIPVGIVVVAVLVATTGSAVLREFGDAAQRAQLLQLALATPALLVFRGTPSGSGAGAIVWYQLFTWVAVVVGLLTTFLVTRGGRAEEERGARETLLALPVSRTAPLVGTVVVGLILDGGIAVGATAALLAVGLPVAGSVLAGLGFGVTGVSFLGVGLLANEVAATGRGANAIAGTVVGVAYALRGAGDALGTPLPSAGTLTPAWPMWLSPIGWVEQLQPYTEARVGLLAPGIALGAVGAAVALLRAFRRDLGASPLPERRGPAVGGVLMRSLAGLGWRLDRTAVLGWALGGAVLAGVTPSLAHAAASSFGGDAGVRAALQSFAPNGSGSIERVTVDGVLAIVGVLAVAAAIQAVLGARTEEATGRAETVLALPVGRAVRLAHAALAGLVAGGTTIGSSAAVVLLASLPQGDADEAWRRCAQQLASFPVVAVATVVTLLAVTVVPRVSVALVWALYGVAVAIGLFGVLLDLPAWLLHASPFTAVPTVPVHDWAPIVQLGGVVLLGGLVFGLAARRRELVG